MKQLTNPYLAALLLSVTAQAAAAERLSDPTRPANAKVSAKAAPSAGVVRLEAVMKSEGHLLAIVNGKLVRAGDRVGESRIDEVLSDGIRLTRGGHSQVIRLAPKAMQVRRNVVQEES